MKTWARVVILSSMSLAGCNAWGGLGHSPTVAVDESFTAEEKADAVMALSLWERAAPEYSFTVKFLPHDVIIAAAKVRAGNEVYLVKVKYATDPDCPTDDGYIQSGAATNENGIVCIMPVNPPSEDMQIFMHEIGHTLGLFHLPYPSVMTTIISPDIKEPTPFDVAMLRKVHRLYE